MKGLRIEEEVYEKEKRFENAMNPDTSPDNSSQFDEMLRSAKN